MKWIPIAERMPTTGTPVLADTGRKYPIRACWVAKFSEEVGASDFDGNEDYDEKTDTSYWPEGWYEWNRHEETHWRVDVPPSQVKHDNIPGALLRDGEKAGGALNPTWVEWLMGWPLGWTDLKPLETDRCRSVQQRHGGF